ncbi:MAG: hypothetical protein K9M99_02870 [Candidatus Cloacimonetes bacterium]|nr:hypothetical protein [Candidatus Cloacimonadota bacterium]
MQLRGVNKLKTMLQNLQNQADEVTSAIEEKRDRLSDNESMNEDLQDDWEEYLDRLEDVIAEIMAIDISELEQ